MRKVTPTPKARRADPVRTKTVYTVRDDGQWSLLVGRWPRDDYDELKVVRAEIRAVLGRAVTRARARKGRGR